MEGDERDRQREMEEIEEIRKRIVDNQPEDMEQDQVSHDQNSQISLKGTSAPKWTVNCWKRCLNSKF